MCLTVNVSQTAKIAEEDIVCYKRVCKCTLKKQPNNGDNFVGVINNIECDGKISIDNLGRTFYCTNDIKLCGTSCINRFGYEYSWIHDENVTSVVVDGVQYIDDLTLTTPYRDFKVKIGKTYRAKLLKYHDEVTRGLHSFAKLENAKKDGNGIYVKCIIPKGSEYYIGIFGECISYASNKLTYVEIVE